MRDQLRSKNYIKNQYYLKDKKINIFKSSTAYVPGKGTMTVYRYLNESPIWAFSCQLTQDQIFAAKTYGESETRLFVLNYRDDLKLYNYIEYKGEYYSITRLDTKDDYNGELFVYVKYVDLHDLDILPPE